MLKVQGQLREKEEMLSPPGGAWGEALSISEVMHWTFRSAYMSYLSFSSG